MLGKQSRNVMLRFIEDLRFKVEGKDLSFLQGLTPVLLVYLTPICTRRKHFLGALST